MKSQTLLDFSKSLGCALMASPNRGKSEGGSRQYYYYHGLLRRTLRRLVILLSISLMLFCISNNLQAQRKTGSVYYADDKRIQYAGRIDFTDPKLPRFWQPGVSITIRVEGESCNLVIQDEMLWGSNHNYIGLVVDGMAIRMQTRTKRDTIEIGQYLMPGKKFHDIQLIKNTEANIGYMEFVAVRCSNLLMPPTKPVRKIECIGNSITCGTGSDMSVVPCGKGKWHDQHNAYMSYAAIMARSLNAQSHLSSVSGIGLMHSCCNMNIIMPQVYDKISMRNDTIQWEFDNYQPDVVTICLGQNDGIQDSIAFCNNYISFLKTLRTYYPGSAFVLLSSPMANDKLRNFMKATITSVQQSLNSSGDKKVYSYIFKKQYSSGCDSHPSLDEHKLIAKELTTFVKKIMKW